MCKQLGKDRCIGILCKSSFLLRAKGKFPWLYEQMVLGLQKTKKIYWEILLLLNSFITGDCRVKQILTTWKPPTHYLATALLKILSVLSIPPFAKLKEKRNKRTAPTSLSCLKCQEARHGNWFGVLVFVSALDISFKRWGKGHHTYED